MIGRPYVLSEITWKQVKDCDYEVAILPWGATEAHNYHLPYSTDVITPDRIATEAACVAWEAGAKVVVLPTVPFGVNTGQLDIPLDINMNPSTQMAVLHDVVDSLSREGVHKLLVVNGHGGNDFKQMVRELSACFSDMFICTTDWWRVVNPDECFDDPGDHSGDMETSVMMHMFPDRILPLSEAGDGAAKDFRIEGLRERWVWSQRQWTQVTKDTGVGNPMAATPEKGKIFFDAVIVKLGAFLVDLAKADINDMYE